MGDNTIERVVDYVASGDHAYGTWQAVEGDTPTKQDLAFSVAEIADSSGNYHSKINGLFGVVSEVSYVVKDKSSPKFGKKHSFSFQDYDRMGRPTEIKVTKSVTYEPVSGE